jgi:hypothetical protein
VNGNGRAEDLTFFAPGLSDGRILKTYKRIIMKKEMLINAVHLGTETDGHCG